MRDPRENAAGFTLIEVMVALAIFGLTAVVLGAAYVNVLNSFEVARNSNVNNEDVYFARSLLLSQADLQTATTGTEFDDGDRHVKWSADIEPANTTDLFAVTFTCEISEPLKGRPRTVVENFMLLRPTWSDPTARSTLRQAAADRISAFQGKTP
jgi:prepilin-type N-terminal cleavage/methylation domain-containing protein